MLGRPGRDKQKFGEGVLYSFFYHRCLYACIGDTNCYFFFSCSSSSSTVFRLHQVYNNLTLFSSYFSHFFSLSSDLIPRGLMYLRICMLNGVSHGIEVQLTNGAIRF
jgi:hypothetical protein